MSDLMLQAVLRMPPEAWSDGAIDVMQRHSRYVQAADELEALRAALDQERADNERLRAWAQHHDDCDAYPLDEYERAWVTVPEGGFECNCGLSALLSGRGEDTSAIIRKVLDDNRDILEALGDE